ncbi:cyclic di-GMP phosphodiesterase Gmr [mine drainage metagenome]|uniref:Cyclic di-GMP phosphodiesterase Gmr n=1 Tax=mine drainage metagenome TaxID=410659 RepID=A0A1J5TBR5_9ZZZZ
MALIITTVLISAMLMVFVVNAWLTIHVHLKHAGENLEVLADATGHSLEGPLIFMDKKGAQESLHSLRANSSIYYAEVRNMKNQVLAQYSIKKADTNIRALTLMLPVKHNLVVNRVISFDKQPLGTLTVAFSLNSEWESMLFMLLQMAVAIVAALVIAIIMARRLSYKVTQPIQQIVAMARKITSGGDYTQRVDKTTDDEIGLLTDEFNNMLTEISHRDQALRESEAHLRLSQAGGGIGTWEADLITNQQKWSENCEALLGVSAPTSPTWEYFLSIVHPEDRQRLIDATKSHIKNGTPYDVEYRVISTDGSVHWIRSKGQADYNTDGVPTSMRGIVQDVSERKQAEADLRIAAIAFESQEGILITDAKGVVLKINGAFASISGYTADELVGRVPNMLSPGLHTANLFSAILNSINKSGSWEGEIKNRRKNGEPYPAHIIVTAVKDSNGIITNYVATMTDITLRKEAEEKIEQLAFYDSLTKLPNRRLLMDRLNKALATSARTLKHGALLFIDLDNFKTLNDTHGHDMGDLLLQQVANRLLGCVRDGDTVARLGGDEFVVMLENINENTKAALTETEIVGEKILTTLNQPYLLSGYKYISTPSIGVTLFNHHANSVDELIKRADIAMYESKMAGRNTIRFFDPDMQSIINARALMDDSMRKAIHDSQFILHYQPQVDNHGRLLGVEALVRWKHPENGLVPPTKFIHLAEENGLIVQLGYWVLETACKQLVAWNSKPETSQLTMSVNVSVRQIHQPDFVDQVLGILKSTGANPYRLKLELTESVLLNDIEATITKMNLLKSKGVSFALDDFGIGYSSLSYLKRLPLDELKIDKSFVDDVLLDTDDAAIARAIVVLAQNMNLKVIAEGVETDEQRNFLEKNGCQVYQGYLFGKPVSIDDLKLS